jgi:hypothetical protein
MALMAKAVEKSRLLMDQIGLVRKEVSIAAVKYGQRGEITVNGIK